MRDPDRARLGTIESVLNPNVNSITASGARSRFHNTITTGNDPVPRSGVVRQAAAWLQPIDPGFELPGAEPSGVTTGKGSMRALGLILGTLRAEWVYLPYSASFFCFYLRACPPSVREVLVQDRQANERVVGGRFIGVRATAGSRGDAAYHDGAAAHRYQSLGLQLTHGAARHFP